MRAWTVEEIRQLQALVAEGKTTEEIAGILKRTHASVQRARERYRKVIPVPAASMPRYVHPLEAEGDMLVIADPHIPCHDAEFLDMCVELALRWGIRQLGIAGDLLDFEALSGLDKFSDKPATVTEQVELARRVLSTLRQTFDIYYCAGNHEMRLMRVLNAGDTVVELMSLWAEGVHVTDYHWFLLHSGGQTFQVEHPRNVSIIPTRVASALAVKYRRNVIAGHGHLWGITKDPSGTFWAIDSGVVCDPARLAWAQKLHNTRPAMLQGAVIIRDGIPFLLNREIIGALGGVRWS